MNRLLSFEKHLTFHISNSSSKVYLDAEARVLAKLFPELQKLVDRYTPLTSLQIFEAATSPKPIPGLISGTAQSNGQKEEIVEVATRIAHIGILHWRVWAPLTYLFDPDAEEDGDIIMRQDSDPTVGRS
jgi:hypothetical protein